MSDRWTSRIHCELTTTNDGELAVIDLNSRHGVYVNDQRTKHATLRAGDVVRIGFV